MKKLSSGKVREIYEVNSEQILILTTDRISAFDVILPVLIPQKGIVLNKISAFWFDYTKDICKNHMICTNVNFEDYPFLSEEFEPSEVENRLLLAKKLKMIPFECIVRGYISGSAWSEYKKTGHFLNYNADNKLMESSKLEEPVFTPTTKADEGHDLSISFDEMANKVGFESASKLREKSIEIYEKCAEYAIQRGIIIADTKFEFGIDDDGQIVLADEICTPDSSRFWSINEYEPGKEQKSFDKQFMRDWLKQNCHDGNYGSINFDRSVIEKTFERYLQAYRTIVPEHQWIKGL